MLSQGPRVQRFPRSRAVYMVGADGSDPRRLVSGVVSAPSWSPDGQWLAYARVSGGEVILAAIRADGTDERHLATIAGWERTIRNPRHVGIPRYAWIRTLAWSPDGAHLMYSCNPHLCVVTTDGRPVGRTPVELSGGNMGTWSPGRVAHCGHRAGARRRSALHHGAGRRSTMFAGTGKHAVCTDPQRVRAALADDLRRGARSATGCSWRLSEPQTLNLSSNGLAGMIPRTFAELTQLRTLNLRRNLLRGPIPSELGRLTPVASLGPELYAAHWADSVRAWPPDPAASLGPERCEACGIDYSARTGEAHEARVGQAPRQWPDGSDPQWPRSDSDSSSTAP